MSEWAETTLGAQLNRVKRKVVVEDGVAYAAVSVTKDGAGLGEKEPFVGGVTNYAHLFRVHEGDVVVRTITAFESPAGVAHAKHDGTHVSGVFLTYEVADDALPAFFELFFQTPMFWGEMQNRATGTVLRRKTISDSAFLGIPVVLPPLAAQRRIVDVMAAVDAQIESLAREVEAAETALSAAQSTLLGEGPGMRKVTIGDIADTLVGYAYKSAQFTDGPDGVPLLRGDNIAPGRLHMETARYWPEQVMDDNRYRLAEGDVVVGMDRTWIKAGLRVATVRAEDLPCLLVQRVARLRAKAGIDPRLIEFLIKSPGFKAMVLSHQTGTSVPHISSKQITGFEVWLPEEAEAQATVGEALTSMRRTIDGVDAELANLRAFRSTLLAALLNQEIEIPESYDALLEAVS